MTAAPTRSRSQVSRWRAVMTRDARADGRFVFAVRTTGIYCRPSCAARHPRRENVAFFRDPAAAERAGFRACRRCHPRERSAHESQAEIVRATRAMLDRDDPDARSLASLARRIGYSPWHLHRMFQRHTGLTPAQYRRGRRLNQFKHHLKEGRRVTEALYDSGYGSSSRVYQRSGEGLGMTPRAYGRGGQATRIEWTTVDTVLGTVLVAATERGICRVQFGASAPALARELAREFPGAEIVPAGSRLRIAVRSVRAAIEGRPVDATIPLDVHASAFQRKVWEALRSIPAGETRSYGEIARRIGRPRAARAVGHACATNPIALLIPCHRVVRGDGAPGEYAWGAKRKRALLEKESNRR